MYRSDTDPRQFDLGRVDIFIREQRRTDAEFRFRHSFLTGTEPRARFGATLARLGDLDNDGFNDIAIAAPYGGPDSAGVVYIFRGSAQGLDPIPAQALHGTHFGLRTFGHSLSSDGLDLDGNGYPDLVVGAYQSDAVVFIRSRPVVRAWISAQSTPRLIDLKDPNAYCSAAGKQTCMSFEICAQYSGKQLPATLRLELRLELDIGKQGNWSQRRAFFNETVSPLLARNYTFHLDQQGS